MIAGTVVSAAEPAVERSGAGKDEAAAEAAWQPLFDGESLKGWAITQFGGQGDVYVEDKSIRLDFGSSLTGITYDGSEFPSDAYELRLQAKRIDGTDFFCGLTFPVDRSHCSLIVGGWGGALVGLSSIDGQDAARNPTQRSMQFRRDQWYTIRVRVAEGRIVVWIDDQKVIDQPRANHEFTTRAEVELSKPLGICAWETSAALRAIEWRRASASP
jgi:hypothetical protein